MAALAMSGQYVIWGVPPHGDMETLLVSESAGIMTIAHARKVCDTLTAAHGCTALRIYKLEPLTDARTVARAFSRAVN
jgi:hypothetical protein